MKKRPTFASRFIFLQPVAWCFVLACGLAGTAFSETPEPAGDWAGQPQVQESSGLSLFSEHTSIWNGVRQIHPLIVAAALLAVVLGVCLLLTDNRELELYFKIDFRPPKTDILN